MEDEQGVIFVSMPSLLDPQLAPEGHHIVHTFTPSSMEAWQGLSPAAYRVKKQADADRLIQRLEAILPGLSGAITHREIGTPRSHRRFLGRFQGSYGPFRHAAARVVADAVQPHRLEEPLLRGGFLLPRSGAQRRGVQWLRLRPSGGC